LHSRFDGGLNHLERLGLGDNHKPDFIRAAVAPVRGICNLVQGLGVVLANGENEIIHAVIIIFRPSRFVYAQGSQHYPLISRSLQNICRYTHSALRLQVGNHDLPLSAPIAERSMHRSDRCGLFRRDGRTNPLCGRPYRSRKLRFDPHPGVRAANDWLPIN